MGRRRHGPSHGAAVLLMVVVTALWATAGLVTRQLEQARSFEVTFWRSAFTLAALLVLLPLWRGPRVFTQMRHGGWPLLVSGICWSLMFTAFMVALTLAPVANVLITMALGPLITALVARIFIGERLPARTWVAIAVAGAGLAWMYGTQLGTGPWLGTLVALCVPVASAGQWTVVQHAHARGLKVDLVPAVLVGAALSSAYTLPLAWPWRASTVDLAWLAFLGVFQLAIPCVLAVLCARVLKAPEVALLALLEVIFGIGLAWVGAGEVPQAQVLTGGLLVVGALVMNEVLALKGRRAAARREPSFESRPLGH